MQHFLSAPRDRFSCLALYVNQQLSRSNTGFIVGWLVNCHFIEARRANFTFYVYNVDYMYTYISGYSIALVIENEDLLNIPADDSYKLLPSKISGYVLFFILLSCAAKIVGVVNVCVYTATRRPDLLQT